MARKWIEVNNLSRGQHFANKNIMFKTPMLRPNLRDYSDAYIVVKRAVDLLAAATNKNYEAEKQVNINIKINIFISG